MNRREGDRSKHREGKDESPCSQVVQTPPVIAGQESRKPAKPSRCSYGYRLKALAEIRNSLLPFATGDPTELSSASSSTASECGSGQHADAGANGLDCNTQYGSVREEETPHIGKFSGAKSIDFVIAEGKSNTFHSPSGNQKQDKINGLTRSNLGLVNLKPLRKGTVQDSCNWELPQRLSENSSSSARSDSPGISITGLQHQILPDPPRLVSGNGGHVSENPCHSHLQLTRQQSPGFSSSDLPPPPPPPRIGTGPATPPLSQSQYGTVGVGSNPQHFFKRASPIPHSTGQQIISSSTSSPQRGASPVSSGRSPIVQLTVAQAKQQLVHQLQNLTIYSNNASSTRTEPPPPYPSSALYSSPPPSYKSSSSGKQSPTPTISSSEYSTPPATQKKCLPTSFTPPPSTNSIQSQQVFSFQVTSNSAYPCTSSTNVLTTVARPSSLQAWSARQAKSQSPVIMQSVKSTQVQKPVLQTAVAPTLPSNTCATHSVSFIQPSPSNQLSACVAFGRAPIGHMMSYPSVPGVPNYSQNIQSTIVDTSTQLSPSSSPTPDLYHTPIASSFYPPNLNTHPSHSMLQQVQISPSYNAPFSSSVLSSANQAPPPPPPYTTSAHQPSGVTIPPPCYPVSSESQPAITNVTSMSSHMHPKQKQKLQPESAMVITSVHNQPTTVVPTTDPPSYATSIAALAAQKAAVSVLNNNLPMTCCVTENLPMTACTSAKTTIPNNETSSHMTMCNLVNTVESICASQVMTLSDANSNLRGNIDAQGEPLSYMLHSPLQRKPSPISMDTGSSASRSESPISRGLSQSPISSMSTTSTSSPSVQSDLTQDSKKMSPSYKLSHQSPIPPRKVLSKEKEDERQESKVKNYSPAAYKFFMEQHVENILKFQQQRQHRRQQLETEMVKVGLSDEAQHQMRKMLHQKESNYIRLKRAKMDKAMFTKIKTIGLGAFGEVALVGKVDTNHLYAMKTLRKSDVLKRNQVAHVKAERDILAEADNEWVVKLYYSFQDQDNLYFVMDYIPGGDLMSLLIKFGVFQEPLARFYIGELVLAVESVHKMGFIHRDIKPDNILIDRDGHIKLTDFGLCTGFRWTHNSKYYQSNGEHGRQDSTDSEEKWSNKCHCKSTANLKPLERRRRREHQRCLAHSLVGTPNYIAPEVLMRLGYTQLCDWWSVGVILYEMLVGQPPFLASTPAETQYKVINWETTLHIPKAANLSKEAADLTLKLCCGPDKRLGRNGADDIKKHPFFNSIDFDGGLRKQPAPYLPRIRYPTDTSNFDPIDIDKLRNSNSSSSDESRSEDGCDNGKHSEHAFFEFTFRRFFDDGGQAYPVRISLDENDGQSSPVYV